jgi:hypothetical protein
LNKTSGHLPYYAESMFPPMEIEWWPCASTEHRADRQKIEARISSFTAAVNAEREKNVWLNFPGQARICLRQTSTHRRLNLGLIDEAPLAFSAFEKAGSRGSRFVFSR